MKRDNFCFLGVIVNVKLFLSYVTRVKNVFLRSFEVVWGQRRSQTNFFLWILKIDLKWNIFVFLWVTVTWKLWPWIPPHINDIRYWDKSHIWGHSRSFVVTEAELFLFDSMNWVIWAKGFHLIYIKATFDQNKEMSNSQGH